MTAAVVARPEAHASKSEVRALLSLAGPMMLAQAGLMFMGLVDTAVVGRVSALEMSGVALGNTFVGVFIVTLMGLGIAIEPLVSQALGAGESARARGWMWNGIYLSLVAAVPIGAGMVTSLLLLQITDVEPQMAERTIRYVWARLPGLPFFALFTVFRSYLGCIGRTRPILVAAVVANVVNLALDTFFVFGLDLGAAGVGLATSACAFLLAVMLAWAVELPSHPRIRLSTKDIKTLVLLGWPISSQLVAEVGIFAVIGLLVAKFGEIAMAGHQIALTLCSFTFMGALGLSNATTVRVGHHVGSGSSLLARRAGMLGFILVAVFMGACALGFVGIPELLVALFAPGATEVVAMGVALLAIAAVFSVSDGLQVVAAGALRGIGDTRFPFLANLAGHWLIGMPVALVMGYGLDLGVVGLWWGFTAGLTAVAILLVLRFKKLSAGELKRLES